MKASSGSGLWPIRTTRMAAPTSGDHRAAVAGADGADDGVAVQPGLHLDPGAAEVRGAMGVVGGDLDERDLLGVVDRPVEASVRHLHRVEGQARRPDDPDAL